MRVALFILAVLCFAVGVACADPVILDLTGGGGGYIEGAYFQSAEALAGSGVFPAFVAIGHNSGIEYGFNTSYRPVQYDADTGKSEDIQVGDLPVVGLDGKPYVEFLLDINEPKSANGRYLSLEDVKIFTSPVGERYVDPYTDRTNPYPPDWSDLGTLRYDFDPGEEGNAVLMDFVYISSGGGVMDLRMLVPLEDIFVVGEVELDHYVYLWSEFGSARTDLGLDWLGHDGFEEWAVNPQGVTISEGGDWGDLPDDYQTSYNPPDIRGAVHWVGYYEWLGPGVWTQDPNDPTALVNPSWDGEEEGVPTPRANGDDLADTDDEDGVEYFIGPTGQDVEVTISVSDSQSDRYDGVDGLLYLDAWWDANGNMQFDEPDEHVVSNTYDPSTWGAGVNSMTYTITIPGYVPGPQAPYLRWRLNYGAPNLSYNGSSWGEVEDYYVVPEPTALALLVVPLVTLARRRRKQA